MIGMDNTRTSQAGQSDGKTTCAWLRIFLHIQAEKLQYAGCQQRRDILQKVQGVHRYSKLI